MIVTPFSTKVLVKDYDMPDEWTTNLISTLEFLAEHNTIACSLTKLLTDNTVAEQFKYDTHKRTKPYIVHEESAQHFTIISDLRNIFLQGFLDLNTAYNTQYTEKHIREHYKTDSGNFAVLKSGQRVGLHRHPSIGFAIFYLTDVDNETDGGELILHDPSFHCNKYFHSDREIRIKTKKNRLIVGAADIWHEVTPYVGNHDRMCAVIDLKR